MQLSSLDITLQRINMIENRFQSLMSYAQKPDADFQKILDNKIEHKKNPTKVSREEINDFKAFRRLITKILLVMIILSLIV